MKRTLALLIALLLCLSLAACGQPAAETSEPPAQTEAPAPTEAGGEDAEPEALSGTLEIWSSGEELGRFVEGFNAIYPDVTVNITVVPNADFIAKLTPALAAGEDVPDIFTGESDYVKYLVESGFWADLEAEPFNADTSDVWDYVKSVGTDEIGRAHV